VKNKQATKPEPATIQSQMNNIYLRAWTLVNRQPTQLLNQIKNEVSNQIHIQVKQIDSIQTNIVQFSSLSVSRHKSALIRYLALIFLAFLTYTASAQTQNHFMAYNWMSLEKIGCNKLRRTFYDTVKEYQYEDTITTDYLLSTEFWDRYSLKGSDNDLFMTYGTQTLLYIESSQLWCYRGRCMNYIDLLEFLVKYSKQNFIDKSIIVND